MNSLRSHACRGLIQRWRGGLPVSRRLSSSRDEGLRDPPRELSDVRFELHDDGIAYITLDRPHRLNALSVAMAESIMHLVDYLSALPPARARAVVVKGSERAFSTGRDLKDSALHVTQEQRDRYMRLAFQSVLAVHRLPMPTIAAMAGPAFGWGVELALACDLRVASLDATICLPETGLGIFPGAGGCVLLRELVGPTIAKDLIFTARRIKCREAKELGVVNVAVTDPFHEAQAIARRIAENGPLGVRGAKEVIEGSYNTDKTTALALSSRLRAPLSETEDFREALEAFAQKRKPVFKGR